MLNLGRAALSLALLIAAYGIAASLYGARSGRRQWVDSGRRAVYALAAVLTVAFVVLEAAFLRSDFSFAVVASHSSTTTPTFYKAAAMCGHRRRGRCCSGSGCCRCGRPSCCS